MEWRRDVCLASYTTLNVGGAAKFFAEAETEEDIAEAASFTREQAVPLFILGGGSNLLVSDAGFQGAVLRIKLRGLEEFASKNGKIVRAAAGEDWDILVQYAVDRGYAGIECLAGIPGTVGGTPVQNVGAYGQEVAETIASVRAYDRQADTFVDLPRESCDFSYRQSIFNGREHGRYIVSRVDYLLNPGGAPSLRYADLLKYFAEQPRPTLAETAAAVREIRRSKGMYLVAGDPDSASAGSFFKNPVISAGVLERIRDAVPNGTVIPQYPARPGFVKLAAAWLVEQAGFAKGYTMGRAGISSRHTLALINRGGASAAEIVALREKIISAVEAKFGIHLQQEPVWLGEQS